MQGRYLHRTIQAHNKRKHSCFEWDSNPLSQRSSGEDSLCFKPRGHWDRLNPLLKQYIL
jgi:hypothetical protein